MSSCAPFTNNLNMWSPISSIYFDQQYQYHHQYQYNNNNNNNSNNNNNNIYNAGGGVITQAASPTLQYTVHDFDEYYNHYTDESKYFHHEPVLYPSACIVCGLAHHPVPHTTMNENKVQETYSVESTPAPCAAAAGPSSFTKKNHQHHPLNHLKTSSHDLEKKRVVKSRNKLQGWGIFFRGLFYRWLSVYQNSIRPSHNESGSRRHNVYPVLKSKKEERLA